MLYIKQEYYYISYTYSYYNKFIILYLTYITYKYPCIYSFFILCCFIVYTIYIQLLCKYVKYY